MVSSLSVIWNVLRTRPIFWVAVGTILLAAIPYVFSLLESGALETYAEYYADVPILILTVLAMRIGGATLPVAERRFWNVRRPTV